jgi:alginate O-acetyltransferase complex protein AlgI
MTLGNWMRNYLYIPLGGNQVSPSRLYFNLVVVFLLSGL